MSRAEKSGFNKVAISAFAGALVVAVLTVFSGVMAGQLANRWGPPEELQKAGKRLQEMPLQCGDWVAEKELTLSAEEMRQLAPAGFINRRYKNETTLDVVSVTVLVGPHGPIAVHTPEICFSSRNYRRLGSRSAAAVGASKDNDQLWSLLFQSREVGAEYLRTYYGWSLGSKWDAAPDPRWTYAGYPYLYKIQVAGLVFGEQAKDKPDNACTEFLKVFLPQLKEHQMDPTRKEQGQTEDNELERSETLTKD